MKQGFVAFFLSLLLASVLATPIRPLKKRSFKIHRIENPNYVANGPAALKRAYAKFGLSDLTLGGPSELRKRYTKLDFGDIAFVPSGEVAARIKAATNDTGEKENGETSAQPTQNDAQFLSPVTVGGQQIIVNFDSGSSDTWVFNTNLPTVSQRGHTVFDPTKSTTFQASQGSTFNISYGDGSSASGPVGFDTLDIGGSTVDQQAIGVPDLVSASFVTDSASNGLVGLAFSKLNTIKPKQQKTFFDNVVSQLSQPVFTAQLKGGTVGSYEFGNIDTSAFTGELAVVKVDSSRGFWEFDSATAVVGGQNIAIPSGKAIADTGTSLMLVQDEMLVGYWNQVDGATTNEQVGGVIFPCNAELPDLQVAVGDSHMAVVPGANMNFAQVGRDTQSGEDFCFGGLQSSQGLPFAIYGDVWFKSQFVVFEATGPSLGVAPHS